MKTLKELTVDYLNAQGIRYNDINETVFTVTYNCENIPSVKATVFF